MSVPALDLHARRRQRWRNIAGYQFANALLMVLLGAVLCGWGMTAFALKANSEALRHFKPIVIRTGDHGERELVAYQDLNSTERQFVIKSALKRWAALHFSRMRSTLAEDYEESFLWMDRDYERAIKAEDQRTKWLPQFLADHTQGEYKLRIKNTVITSLREGETTAGRAEIFGWMERYSSQGIPQPENPQDDVIILVRWALAKEPPADVRGQNALGVAILPTYTVNPSEGGR